MLSPQRCRQLLGTSVQLSDDQVIHLRDHLYVLAQLSVRSFVDRSKAHEAETTLKGDRAAVETSFAEALKVLGSSNSYEIEERAAIYQFEGGLSRSEAERQAARDWSPQIHPQLEEELE